MSLSLFLPFVCNKAIVRSNSDVVKRHVPFVNPSKPGTCSRNRFPEPGSFQEPPQLAQNTPKSILCKDPIAFCCWGTKCHCVASNSTPECSKSHLAVFSRDRMYKRHERQTHESKAQLQTLWIYTPENQRLEGNTWVVCRCLSYFQLTGIFQVAIGFRRKSSAKSVEI